MDSVVPRLSQLLDRDAYLHPYAHEIERRCMILNNAILYLKCNLLIKVHS